MEEHNKQYVVDASFVLAFLLQENNSFVDYQFRSYLEGNIRLTSSSLLTFEVGNGMRSAVLRNRVPRKTAVHLFRQFLDLDIAEETIDYEQTLEVALHRKISFYDASYIYLAKKKEWKLLTLDTLMQK